MKRDCFLKYLKPAFQEPAVALVALNEMATSPDRDIFRKKLLECKSTSMKIKRLSFEEKVPLAKDRKGHKKYVRKEIKSEVIKSFVMICDNPECHASKTSEGQNLGQCGCRSVAYLEDPQEVLYFEQAEEWH